jgi:hypothetical protein
VLTRFDSRYFKEEAVRKFFFSLLVTAIMGFAAGCGSSSGPTPVGVPVGNTGGNVLSIKVDGGPISGVNYEDAAFASAKICAPGSTSSCVTVDHLLVDTGSVGIRVLASALGAVALPVTTDGSGNNLNDCVQFADTSYVWGLVESADVTLAGEVASNVPVHVLADPTGFAIPSTCNTGGPDEDQLGTATTPGLGANGILGIGQEPVDCLACDQNININAITPPTGAYYLCSSTSCQSVFVPEANQVTNPVVAFPVDNNGVIVELPAPTSSTAATLTGSLIFGIGTQSNNGLGSATIYAVDTSGNFTTVFPATNGQTLNASFIDSGSNGIFFPDSAANVPVIQCADNTFYCPASTQALSAQNLGANGASGTVSFSVDNADSLFANDSSDAILQNLAGSNGIGTCVGGVGQCTFDWGLPFFYGRNVYTAIDGQPVPSTASAAAPWWAY